MRLKGLLGGASLMLVLGAAAGCGGDGGDTAEDASPATSPTASSSEPTGSGSASASASTAETSSAPPSESAQTTGTAESAQTREPVDLTVAPTTYDEGLAHLEAAADAGGESTADRFSTPGDAIYCVLEHEFIAPSCELLVGAIKDPQVCGNAPSEFVGRIELTRNGASPQCNTDTIREPGAKVVRPTAVVGSGGVRCAIEPIGVTCVDAATLSGFFLTQGKYTTF